mmetsp:Transcript_4426/g.11475  ORF Transcript_4426/g.11475 Transcript_4426/m.11475 type:complete len:95 (+) Transcript_4426:368-652(+)
MMDRKTRGIPSKDSRGTLGVRAIVMNMAAAAQVGRKGDQEAGEVAPPARVDSMTSARAKLPFKYANFGEVATVGMAACTSFVTTPSYACCWFLP